MKQIVRYFINIENLQLNSLSLSPSLVNQLQDKTIESIQNAKLKIRKEIRELKERLKVAQEHVQLFKEKVELEEPNGEEN
jgi:hypothetical protein